MSTLTEEDAKRRLEKIAELVQAGHLLSEHGTMIRQDIAMRTASRQILPFGKKPYPQDLEDTADSKVDYLMKEFRDLKRANGQPWYADADTVFQLAKEFAKRDPTEARDSFASRCKARSVTPEDTLIMAYLHEGTPADVKFLRGLMDRIYTWPDRIKAHNFYVAMASGQTFLTMYGNKLRTLRWPLFPPGPEYEGLNICIIEEAAGTEGGDPDFVPSVYRARRRRAPEGGAYYVGVQASEHGPFVDLSAVEESHLVQVNMIAELKKEVTELHKTVAFLQKRANNNNTNHNNNQHNYNNNQNNNYNNNNYSNNNNNNYRSNRDNGGARGPYPPQDNRGRGGYDNRNNNNGQQPRSNQGKPRNPRGGEQEEAPVANFA